MSNFESIIIMPRMMPFRTKLLPDFQTPWGYEDIPNEIPKRIENIVNNFSL